MLFGSYPGCILDLLKTDAKYWLKSSSFSTFIDATVLSKVTVGGIEVVFRIHFKYFSILLNVSPSILIFHIQRGLSRIHV